MVAATENGIIGKVGVAMSEVPMRGTFTEEQVSTLLRPINPKRVLQLDGNSHVSQQDIRAHLIRVFGFGSYDVDVLAADLVFEDSYMRTPKRGGAEYKGFDVCYRALVRLTVRNPDGEYVAHYEDGSTATAQGQRSRGDAHDLAYKSAISLSLKRAAIALGDQFGLSLYNKGQQTALVKTTLVGAPGEKPADVQENIDQQVTLGNDEVERDMSGDDSVVNHATGEVTDAEPAEQIDWVARAKAGKNADELRAVWEGALAVSELTQPVKSAVLARKHELDTAPPAPAEEPAPADEATTPKDGE